MNSSVRLLNANDMQCVVGGGCDMSTDEFLIKTTIAIGALGIVAGGFAAGIFVPGDPTLFLVASAITFVTTTGSHLFGYRKLDYCVLTKNMATGLFGGLIVAVGGHANIVARIPEMLNIVFPLNNNNRG